MIFLLNWKCEVEKKMETKRIAFTLPVELYKTVKIKSVEKGCTMSEMLVFYIQKGMENENSDSKP